ncbi:MAG: tetratricopeptide repeat protein [Thermomonas sp.]
MTEIWQRLKQRKLVQWAVAYAAGAWALLQVLDMASGSYGWPTLVMRVGFGLVALGFVVTLLLAWYHGEKGEQKISGIELLLLSLVLAVGGVLIWRSNSLEPVIPTAALADKSIAVLPFENLSSNKDNEYFVSGMQDMILTSLSKIDALKVISRTSTEKYASRPENLKQVAAELGVAHILEGSVQRQGDKVLINLQLIDARTDTHLWADSFDRDVADVFKVEKEVASLVAETMRAKLLPAEQAKVGTIPTTNQAAYDLFLRGGFEFRRFFQTTDGRTLSQAITYYEQAVKLDPMFALAYAKLASARLLLFWKNGEVDNPQTSLAQRALDAANRAKQLDPGLVEADLALAEIQYRVKLDYRGALAAYDSVLARQPHQTDALYGRMLTLRRLGRFEEAIVAVSKAMALDPLNTKLSTERGLTRMFAGHLTGAESDFRHSLSSDPEDMSARRLLSTLLLARDGNASGAVAIAPGSDVTSVGIRQTPLIMQRKYDQALAELQSLNGKDLGRDSEGFDSAKGSLLMFMGRTQEAKPYLEASRKRLDARLADLPVNSGSGQRLRYNLAEIEGLLGNTVRSIELVKQAQSLLTVDMDAANGSIDLARAAHVYARIGRLDLALPLLAHIRQMPGSDGIISSSTLRMDPVWDKVRDDPRLQTEIKRFAKHEKTFD